eukprot:6174101-Pleurochrysis_carterae.AAC.1
MLKYMVMLVGEDAEALVLQVQEGARIKEDVSAERKLCNVVQAGEVVYRWWREALPVKIKLGVKLSDLTR